MIDTFPFPRITSSTPNEMISELVEYLVKFKETLEFTLGNLSVDNFSPELQSKLQKLSQDIQSTNPYNEEELAQLSGINLTISDVCDSQIFKDTIESEVSKYMISFNVNYETGHLEFGNLS